MLKKIISIKNVGRFQNYTAVGDLFLKRYSLVFAENGRGKTMLCAILRSLQSGNPDHIIGRTTLGAANPPDVNILLDAGNVTFGNGAWTATLPEIAIFDWTFISENVYSGDDVDIDHRRSLYKVIVGQQGVAMAQQIETFDTASRAKSTEIREKAAPVQLHVPPEMTLDGFLALAEDPAIDDQIASKERELDAVRQADQIRNRAALSNLALPTFRAAFETLLGKTVEGIAADAEQRIAAQIRAHEMHARGETWLSEGLQYIRNESCPFCSQPLGAVGNLIAAYKAYFSQAYNALRAEIAAMRRQLKTGLGDREIAAIVRTIDQNKAAVEFWARFCEITPPATDGVDGIDGTLTALRQAALTLLDRKAAAPLEAVPVDEAFRSSQAAAATAQQATAVYNQAVAAANALVTAKKAATGASDVRTVENALTRLRAIKKRHDPAIKKACEDYERAKAEKTAIEEQKNAVRAQLDQYTQQILGRYEQTINRFLENFHAGFRIAETKHGYAGGVASSSYQILINNTPVDLGDATTPLDRPSFKNTLSAGDRSTLALAFFLAQLDHDPGKANKIVILDDPFNSQDSFRTDCTVQKIKKCGETSAQVIVLSHDPSFLKRIWDRLHSQAADRKCLEMARIGQSDTTICEWDIEKATQDQYRADRKALTDYYLSREGNPRDVVQKIRPVLETYSKNLGAGALADADTLGIIVGKLRTIGLAHQLFPVCDDLEELNEYTKRYHHGENPQAATEPISDTELQGYVKRTLDMTGGCY